MEKLNLAFVIKRQELYLITSAIIASGDSVRFRLEAVEFWNEFWNEI